MKDKELDTIIKDNVPKLHSYVRGRIANRSDAEDIVQDTIYQFLRTINVLDNPVAHVSSWLYTVAHNLIVNSQKKHREESLPYLFSDNGDEFMRDLSDIMVDNGSNPELSILRNMIWKEWQKALEDLPHEQREAVIMTEIEGMSVKEASRKMNVSQNTFLSRKHYAVKYIRKRLHILYNELITK